MPPLGGQPGVVEIEPANERTDVERRHDRFEFVGGARNACTTRHRRTGHGRTQKLGAGRVRQRQETTGQCVHQTIARGVVGQIAADLAVADVVGNTDEHPIRLWTFCGANVRESHCSFLGKIGVREKLGSESIF